MNEIVLELAAFALTLFCLIYSVTARREPYFPTPKGIPEKLKNQHTVFLVLLCALAVSAAAAMAEVLGRSFRAGPDVLLLLNTVCACFWLMLPCFFALYLLDLSGTAKKLPAWFFGLFFLPLLLGELLVLTNPFTGLVFRVSEGQEVLRGAGYRFLYLAAALYAATGLLTIFRSCGTLSKTDCRSALLLLVVAVSGMLIQAIWSVPVELFFSAIAIFGGMSLLEHDVDASEHDMSERFRGSAMAAVVLAFLAVLAMNVTLILNLTGAQSEEIGNIQLDVIRSDLQDTISAAEANLLQTAMHAEQLLDTDPTRAELTRYLNERRENLLSGESFMHIFIAGSDWHIIPGFDAPPDFHAAERVWYLGAAENPGEIYVTDPYMDADTGAMCFTVSTLLSDGETVVGLDLNFSKAQESILRMTGGKDRTAMIVTSGGLIVGYSDMSLVGERADEKLPEFSEVLRRVTASQEHGSFRVTLDGRPCIIFSSETSNNWYLILSVGTDTLYAESYRQIAMMAAVNLLMLLVIVVFYMTSSRNRLRAAAVLVENRRFVNNFIGKLRELTARILRYSDRELLRDGADPGALIEQIRDSGEQLSELADDARAYSESLREQAEEEERRRAKRQRVSTEAPSRRVRVWVVATLLFTLAVSLFFCVRITASRGSIRMNREADSYENQLAEWLVQQQSILCMFTDMIAAQPQLMDDYDTAVRWLNDIAGHYPEISLCYLANPYAEIPVIMNNGWIPGEDYRPETRPWYRATERAADHFSVSAPYLDAQSGNYCITLSRVVYGEKDEFLGIFGIDFFLDKLIHVLGESYTSRSYAFLVDSDGVIINHPNEAYQMGSDSGVSVEDTEYAEAYNREGVTALRDYTGRLVSCLSRKTDSGFTVMVANRWWSIYGSVVLVTLVFLALFGFCILFIVSLINRLIRWQADVNRQLVEAAETAVNAGKAKSQFLARMSHEIRTPMNAIIGLDNIALHDPDLPPHARGELEKIGASARHLLALINDILDMSRIESGRMELKEQEFPLRDLLEQINVIVGGQCADKGLRYVCSAEGIEDAVFVGDDLKLKQVLINILGNSVKFTDPPGIVSFTVEQIDCDESVCGLRFTMKDTGVGMDEDFIPKLFEAFSQEDATATNHYGGSGLGMAITKSIVEMMGGKILVESKKGIGSTFTVTVPLKRALRTDTPEQAQAEESAEDASVAGLHVLIAEDNELNAEILTDLLEMEEISSEWAENGQLAVELFAESAEGHFNAVLMDMRMPVMDGLTAAGELRKLDRADAKTVPIIALTANAFEEDVQNCLRAGMNEHLSKPVDIELLKKALSRLCTRR